MTKGRHYLKQYIFLSIYNDHFRLSLIKYQFINSKIIIKKGLF